MTAAGVPAAVAGVLAYATAVLHAAFLVYLVLGGLLAWRWPRTLVLHLAAVGWGVLALTFSLPCVLTVLEDALRRRAGWQPLDGGFVDAYVEGVLFPDRWSGAVRAGVALVVLVGWAGLLLRPAGGVAPRRAPLPAPRCAPLRAPLLGRQRGAWRDMPRRWLGTSNAMKPMGQTGQK